MGCVMRTVLITGGAGFVGSHVVERFLAEGLRVVVVDNLTTGVREHVPPGAEFHNIDILTPEFTSLVGKVKPDTIVHLAAQVSVAVSVRDPVLDADVNVGGTLRVLEAAREHQVPNFVFSSSAAVYGIPSSLPVTEDAPFSPLSPYGIAKVAAEGYIRAYCFLHGLKAVVMRYSNVFGPRQKAAGDGGVVANFVEAILRGHPPVFFGDGGQTRDFIYVKDVADATLKAIDYLDKSGTSEYLVVNISSGVETSLRTLYTLLCELVKQAPEPILTPPREGDIRHSCLDNRKAREYLGWLPGYSLEQGILETVTAARLAGQGARL
ncbi:UDP-glucose 4-epimerase [Symbiobacterium thermophilum IAM 14863]|uniref:UDP-glucose 4-epimerase n=2 Tax=Symbiobacterium thermophilum TaxID=2734 RepID=Q67KU6_SYMTH|nr:UDP-glucose 4-epimerase [Symbiobacterium thermophilum IAM 14863]